jgi:Secretion system C-terminal sorting domain
MWGKVACIDSTIAYPYGLAAGMTVDNTGKIYITGTFTDQLEIGNIVRDVPYAIYLATDGYYAGFSNTGDFLWAKFVGGNEGTNQCYEIAYDLNSDNLLLTGGFTSRNVNIGGVTIHSLSLAGDESFVAEIDKNGNGICGIGFAYGGDDVLALAIDNSGYVYLCGDAMNGTKFYTETDSLVVQGEESFFMSKLDRCPGTVNKVRSISKDNELLVYPDPAQNEITVAYGGVIDGSASLVLYDLMGRVVLSTEISQNTTSIDVSALKNGMYFCKLLMNDASVTRKIIIQK